MPHAFEFDLSISRGVITHNMFCVSTLCFSLHPPPPENKNFSSFLRFMHNDSLKENHGNGFIEKYKKKAPNLDLLAIK